MADESERDVGGKVDNDGSDDVMDNRLEDEGLVAMPGPSVVSSASGSVTNDDLHEEVVFTRVQMQRDSLLQQIWTLLKQLKQEGSENSEKLQGIQSGTQQSLERISREVNNTIVTLRTEFCEGNREVKQLLAQQSQELVELKTYFTDRCVITENRVEIVESRLESQSQEVSGLSQQVGIVSQHMEEIAQRVDTLAKDWEESQVGITMVQSSVQSEIDAMKEVIENITTRVQDMVLDTSAVGSNSKSPQVVVAVVKDENQLKEEKVSNSDHGSASSKRNRGEHRRVADRTSIMRQKHKRNRSTSDERDSFRSDKSRRKHSKKYTSSEWETESAFTRSSDSETDSDDDYYSRRRRGHRGSYGVWNVSANELHPDHLKFSDAITDNPADWIAKVERHFRCLGQCLEPSRIENLLTGEASAWYSLEADSWGSWRHFKKQFLKHFRRSEVTLKKLIYAETQKAGESFVTYVSRIDRMNKMLARPINQRGIFSILVHGCQRSLRRTVADGVKRANSLSRLISIVAKEERIWKVHWEKSKDGGETSSQHNLNPAHIKKYERANQSMRSRDNRPLVGVVSKETMANSKGKGINEKQPKKTMQTSECQTDPMTPPPRPMDNRPRDRWQPNRFRDWLHGPPPRRSYGERQPYGYGRPPIDGAIERNGADVNWRSGNDNRSEPRWAARPSQDARVTEINVNPGKQAGSSAERGALPTNQINDGRGA